MEAEVENGVKEKSHTEKSNQDASKEDQEAVLLTITEKKHQPSSEKTQAESAVTQNHGDPMQEQVLAKKPQCLEHSSKNEQKANEIGENRKANLPQATREKNISSKEKSAQDHKLHSKSAHVVNSVPNGNCLQKTCPKMCKPRSDPNIKSTQDQKSKSDSTRANGHKMCKPCSDTDMKSIQDLKSKIDSARASGKSINALLYSMDNDDNNNEEEKIQESDDVKNGYNQQEVSFSLEADELSGQLEKLTVENTERQKKASPTESDEDSSLLSKGPMTGYPKHPNLYKPFNIQDRLHQPQPQQVPGYGEIGDLDVAVSVEKFYDEDSLLKALDGIVPESSPEHYPSEPLPNENFTEVLPLPPACPSGVNNQYYPTHEMSLPRTKNTGMSSLPGNFMHTSCTNPQQRSTSADAIKKTEFVSLPSEPRPNSYPSTHNETIEDLFEYASDIIDKDLRKANQNNSDQRLKMANPESVLGLYQQTRPNPPNPSYIASSLPVPRSHPPSNHGLGEFNTQGNQNFTRIIAARPSKISDQLSQFHPNPREVQATLTKTFQEGSNGNLPNILGEITDNPLETKIPLCKPSPLGGPQIQQNVPFPQNPALIHRPPLVSDGADPSGLRPKTGHSNMNGRMIELTPYNISPPSQIIRAPSAPHNVTTSSQFYNSFVPKPTNSTGVQPLCNPGAQQGPLKVIFCQPHLNNPNNQPKPRYRKILPKPTPPVEGGK